MDFLHEYSLLIAVALPVAVVVGINFVLAVTGESGTLLLPSLRGYPVVDTPRIETAPEAEAPAAPMPAPAEHEEYRKAA